MNLDFKRKLPIPMELKERCPLDKNLSKLCIARDTELKNILSGKNDRIILIVGPCSADNETAMIEYATALRKVYDKVKEKIFIIPRIYTAKPRTKLNDYKGLLHNPNPNGEPDMWLGIMKTRELHMKVLMETGMNGADELLYVNNYKYIDDIACYMTVGARSVENQEHRLVASGISCPVGMKNPMSGDLNVLINSIIAGENKHTFIYRNWEVISKGNPFVHAILRGYTDKNGVMIPNYTYDNLVSFIDIYEKSDTQNKSIIVDCNHANSKKNYELQKEILFQVENSRKKNNLIKKFVKGYMIESYIEGGSQGVYDKTFGKSITDSCLSFEETNDLILRLADTL